MAEEKSQIRKNREKRNTAKKPKHPRDFENMDDKSTLHRVIEDLETSQEFQRPFFDKFVEYYKLYRSYIDEKDKREHGANLFIPYTFHVIETVTPKVVNSLFSTRPYVQTIPLGVDNKTREQRSEKMNKLLDYQFQQKIKLVPKITDVIKTALMYGTAITKQGWKFKKKNIITKKPKKVLNIELPIYTEVMEEVVVNDEPMIQNIPITDFFFDPAGTDIDDCRYCIHRYYEDLHVLKEKQQKGFFKNVDKLDKDTTYIGDSETDMLTHIGLSNTENRKKGVEILDYWTDDWRVIVANRSVVIYSGRNPYYHMKKPFARWIDTPVPNEFYGIGEIEPIVHLQQELNTTRNQRIDNVSLIINKMYSIIKGSGIDPNQLISRPGGFIEVDSHDDIQELKFQDVTKSSYQEESVIKNDIDRTLGVYDTARGSSPERRETATTMSILADASADRFKIKTLQIENGGFHEMINQIIRLNQQFIDRPVEINIVGDDRQVITDKVTPEEIAGEYDIVAVGSSMESLANKEIRRNQLIQLYNIIAGNPMINEREFLRRLLESFEMRNIDELIAQPQIPQGNPQGSNSLEQLPPELLVQVLKGGGTNEQPQ